MAGILLNANQAGNRSGTGRYVVELVRAFAGLESAHRVSVDAGGPLLSPTSDFMPPVQPAATWRKLLREHWHVPQRARRFDLVHYPAGMGPLLDSSRLVLTVHDLVALRHPEWFPENRAAYYRWAARRGVTRATRLIADSQATTQDLQEQLAVPAENIDVVPLGVSAHFYPRPEAEQESVLRGLGLPRQFVLFAGTLEPRKNLLQLVRAWEQIAGTIEEDLIIAGRRGWQCAELLRACARSPYTSRIHLPSHIPEDQLPALLSSARAFVWPSLYEGFGLPPLEAMACGAPVVTSNTSSLPEVVGDAAIQVNPEDAQALAEAVQRVLEDPARAEDLRRRGLARAAQFTWTETARHTLESYEKALQS